MISRTFILSVDFALPDLSALVTVPIAIISVTPVIPCRDKLFVPDVSPLIVNPFPADNIFPDPVPAVTTTIKSSLSLPLTQFKPVPALTDVAPPLMLPTVTDVLKRPDGFIVLLLFVFFTAS